MADITVTVTSPGLQAYGSSTFGAESFGGLEPSASSSTGTLSVEANANVSVTGISLLNQIGTTSQAFSSKILVDSQLLTTNIDQVSISGDSNVSVTGSSSNLNIGLVIIDAELQVGWGGDAWGQNDWGDLSGAYANPTGISLSANIGSVITEADANVYPTGISLQIAEPIAVGGTSALIEQQGLSLQTFTGNETTGIGAVVTGSQLGTNITSVTIDDQPLIGSGWGRSYWGDFVWGDAYSVQTGSVSAQTAINGVTTQADANVNAQGQQLFVVTGNETPQADANVFPTGINIQSNIGEVQGLSISGLQMSTGVGVVDIQAGGNIFVNVAEHTINTFIGLATEDISVDIYPTGLSLTTNIGDETAFTDVEVSLTGIPLTTSIGNETAFTDVVVSVTGQQLTITTGNENAFTDVTVSVTGSEITGSLGNITPISTYTVDGISATTSIGSVTVQASADVPVTGSGLTINTITPNIIAWAEVDTGTDVVWTPVDLAA